MKEKITLKSIKKYRIIILVVVVLLAFILSFDNDKKEMTDYNSTNESVKSLEKRLADILGNIDGAGRVDVMITLASEGEKIILKDNQSSDTSTLFGSSKEPSNDEKTVMTKDGSKEEPFVRKQTKAEIRGVIVCCDGAYDEFVKEEITSSCIAVLDVPLTRVSVVKRKE